MPSLSALIRRGDAAILRRHELHSIAQSISDTLRSVKARLQPASARTLDEVWLRCERLAVTEDEKSR